MEKIFKQSIDTLVKYITDNNIKALILGISGGIDSTVCAAICYEASKQTGIPLIGRSLPTINNKEGETKAADLVGNAFCDSYKEVDIQQLYNTVRIGINTAEISNKAYSPIANGNVQARLRMIYLYNLASIHKGMVIDTDNLTEHYLGYWTLHGDVGDYKPIGNLWKTEVFKLAEWIREEYWKINIKWLNDIDFHRNNPGNKCAEQAVAILKSSQLQPTAGLGITSNDLEELGAESYEQVDSILQEIVAWKKFAQKRGDYPTTIEEQKVAFLAEQQMLNIPIEIIVNVVNRHFNSEFKRK
jgi:NAD+ synthetase